MKWIITLCLCVAFITAKTQITVNQNDMPNVGDTIRISTTTLTNFDGALTGENFVWDYSTLHSNNQRLDTFMNVLQTPVTYNVAFNNPLDQAHKASYASPQAAPMSPPGGQVTITEVYNFYKETSTTYSQVGFGAKVNGVPTPMKYDNPEIFFNFPLSLGAIDSSDSYYSVNIHSLGFYGERRKRVNTVDGWGKLTTPLGTFDVWRVKSNLNIVDTFYYSAMSFGTKIPYTAQEYKWIGDNKGLPILQINVRNNTKTAIYIDTLHIVGMNEMTQSSDELKIFPNPTSTNFTIRYKCLKNDKNIITVRDTFGRIIHEYFLDKTSGELSNIELKENGVFFISINNNKPQKLIKL